MFCKLISRNKIRENICLWPLCLPCVSVHYLDEMDYNSFDTITFGCLETWCEDIKTNKREHERDTEVFSSSLLINLNQPCKQTKGKYLLSVMLFWRPTATYKLLPNIPDTGLLQPGVSLYLVLTVSFSEMEGKHMLWPLRHGAGSWAFVWSVASDSCLWYLQEAYGGNWAGQEITC